MLPRLIFVLVFLHSVPALAQGSRGDPAAPRQSPMPLVSLLGSIPLLAEGEIALNDLAAARRAVLPLVTGAPSPEQAQMVPLAPLFMMGGFDLSMLRFSVWEPGGLPGFSIADLGQIAGWGRLPEARVIVAGLKGHEAEIAAAFEMDGLERRTVDGVTVWHRGADLSVDLNARSDSPFGGQLGVAVRFALRDGMLLHARSWAGIQTLLEPGATLDSDTDAVAILAAAHILAGAGGGEVLAALLVAGQPSRIPDAEAIDRLAGRGDAAALPGADLPGLPPFQRFGIVHLQNGLVSAGVLLLPYHDSEAAQTAVGRFAEILEVGASIHVDRSLDQILPSDRDFRVVEAAGRHVAVLAFSQSTPLAKGLTMANLSRAPARRLYDMYVNGDLALLIGVGE